MKASSEGGSAELFFVNEPFASFDPPSHFSPAGVLLWRGDGNPGTWQQAADLLVASLLLPFLFLGPPLLYSSPALALSLYLPLPGSACFVPCLIFHGIYFI